MTKRCFSHDNRDMKIFVGVGGRVEGPTIINKYAGCTRDDHFGVDSDAGRHYLYCKKGCKADFKVVILGKSFYMKIYLILDIIYVLPITLVLFHF